MTDLLSQEEIDALLRTGTASREPPASGPSVETRIRGDASLTKEQLDQLTEVAKLSLGATSSVIQMLLNRPIDLNLSQVRVITFEDLAQETGRDDYILAKISYVQGFDGNSYLLLRRDISAIIGDLMMGGDGTGTDFQEMHMSAVGEIMNQMMGKTTTSLSEIFKRRVELAPPQVEMVNFSEAPPTMSDFTPGSRFLRIGYSLRIGDIAETEMVQMLPSEFALSMAKELAKPDRKKPARPAPQPAPMPEMVMPSSPAPAGVPNFGPMPGLGGMPGLGLPPQMPQMGLPGQMPSMQGNPAEFGMLQMPMGMGLQSNIDLLLDVPLQITVELGRTRMLIKDVLELGIGSVVELNKLAGEAVEVFVNSKLIAKGEVVVIDENFAVRITSIVNPQDRLQAL